MDGMWSALHAIASTAYEMGAIGGLQAKWHDLLCLKRVTLAALLRVDLKGRTEARRLLRDHCKVQVAENSSQAKAVAVEVVGSGQMMELFPR